MIDSLWIAFVIITGLLAFNISMRLSLGKDIRRTKAFRINRLYENHEEDLDDNNRLKMTLRAKRVGNIDFEKQTKEVKFLARKHLSDRKTGGTPKTKESNLEKAAKISENGDVKIKL
jgi:hypothetical protein